MAEATIEISDPQIARSLFGLNDENLRRVRDQFAVDVVYRNEELVIRGEDEAVAGARQAFEQHLAQLNGTAQVAQDENRAAENGTAGEVSIEIFERARKVKPRSPGQEQYVDAIRAHDLVFCAGPAGCGKTYLAVAMALHYLRTEQIRKIVLVRPAVEAGEKLGFLPGDMLAKVNPFLRPLLDALQDLLNYDQVKRYMDNDIIEIVPLAFMRGRTLNEAFMILDEAQNTTATQMKMFLTRMGNGSKIVVTGDETQTDLPDGMCSGLTDAMRRLARIDGIAGVRLTGRDIVRHRLVREIVEAYDSDEKRAKPKTPRRSPRQDTQN